MDLVALPPTLDCAPEFCFCGRKTIESHEFWFCSTDCARLDALRSLDNPNCHYRNVVRDAYARAGAPALQPRRMVSAVHLRPGPSEHRVLSNVHPPFTLPTNLPHQANVIFTHGEGRDRNMPGFPTLSQVTGKVLTKKTAAGEPLVAGSHDRPRWEGLPTASSRARPAQRPDDTFKQISLDVIPLPEHAPARSLRRVPPSTDTLRNNTGKSSIAALLNFSRSRKNKDPETVFGHAMNPITPPVRKESLPSYRQMNPPSTVPVQTSKAVRRSASFAGWNATAHGGRGSSNGQDSLIHMIEEMREELSESFDPRSLFDQEEEYY